MGDIQLSDDLSYPERLVHILETFERKTLLTHEHVTCTLDAGGDAPQLTSKETRPDVRYASSPAGAFVDPKPHTPERDPIREHSGYGLP